MLLRCQKGWNGTILIFGKWHFETSKIVVDESAIFKGMVSFDRKPRPTHRWSTSLRVKRVALHNERLRSRILKTMSWILSNNKNMANVPPTTNEIRINRKETQKKLSKHINSLCLWKFLQKKWNRSHLTRQKSNLPWIWHWWYLQNFRDQGLQGFDLPQCPAKRIGRLTICKHPCC